MDSVGMPYGARLFIQFSDWCNDVAIAAANSRERLDAIRDELPDDLQRYFVMKFSTTYQPVLRVRLAAGNGIDLSCDYYLIDREVKRRLERIAGGARLVASGAMPYEVEIAIAPHRLTAHDTGLTEPAQPTTAPTFSRPQGA